MGVVGGWWADGLDVEVNGRAMAGKGTGAASDEGVWRRFMDRSLSCFLSDSDSASASTFDIDLRQTRRDTSVSCVVDFLRGPAQP